MPMFTNYSNAIKPPEVDDLGTAQAKSMQLRQMAVKGQLDDATLRAALLGEKDDKETRAAYKQAGGDTSQAIKILAAGGGSPRVIQALQKGQLEADEKRSTIDKNRGQGAAAAATAKEKGDTRIGNALQSLQQLPPDERPAAYAKIAQELKADKVWHAGDSEDYPGDVELHRMTDSYLGAKAAQERDKLAREAAKTQQEMEIAKAVEGRNAAKAPAELDAANIKTRGEALQLAAQTVGDPKTQEDWDAWRAGLPAAAQKEVPAVMTPGGVAAIKRAGMTTVQQVQTAQTKTRDDNTAMNEAEIRKQGRQRIGLEAADLAIKKQRWGFDQSGGISTAAAAVAKGDMDPQTARSLIKSNPGILDQIKRADPDFDMANLQRRYDTLKEFNSTSNTKAGGQALALNTLIHHADLYMKAGEALKNGNFVPGNEIYNKVKSMFGSAPPQNAALLARFFAGETGKVATGGVPAEGEINGILKSLGTSSSPGQIADAGKTLLQIAAGRATPLMERVNESKLGNIVKVLGPDAKEILGRNGFDPETMKLRGSGAPPPAGGGKVIDPATAQQFYKQNGNDPAKARAAALAAGWKLQ